MRRILLVAVGAAALSGPAAMAQEFKVQLSPKDPKYNSSPCRSMREKAKSYKNGLLDQSPATYIFAGVMPGGTVGFLALQHRKDELFRRDIEQACMTNPPDRSYLDQRWENRRGAKRPLARLRQEDGVVVIPAVMG